MIVRSSSGQGPHTFDVKITGSNPVRITKLKITEISMRLTRDDLGRLQEILPEVDVKILEYLVDEGLSVYGEEREVNFDNVDEGYLSLNGLTNMVNDMAKEGYTSFFILGYRRISFVKSIDNATIRKTVIDKISNFDRDHEFLLNQIENMRDSLKKKEDRLNRLKEAMSLCPVSLIG